MPMSCAAFNCTNRFLKGNGISFHRFPFSKPDLIEHWLVNIRRQGWKPSKYSHICSDHFDDDCYIGGPHRRRVLKADAVPTKFNFTIKDPRKLPLKSDNQEFPECLIQIKEEADNDDWPNPPAEYCASPVEGKKTILRDNHLEQLSNIDDSAKSSDSESFHEQEEESSSSEDHSEDDSVKPPDSGIFQIQYGELITSESYSEEQNSSSVDYTAKPLENGIFQVQKIELISSEDDQSQDSLSEEQEFSDIYYSALPSSAAEIQREPSLSERKIWTAPWSDNVFLEDFVYKDKLPQSTPITRKTSVKTRKVVYYGELTNRRVKGRLNKENVLFSKQRKPCNQQIPSVSEREEEQSKSTDKPSSPPVAKQENILSSSIFQIGSAIPSANNTDQKPSNGVAKTKLVKHDVPQGKKFELDNVLAEQKVNNGHHVVTHTCQSDSIPVITNSYNKTTGQEVDVANQNNGYTAHQLDIMDVDTTNINNSNRVFKKEKQTDAGSHPTSPIVINGHTYSISIPPSEMKRHYDEEICKKDKQLSVLRKRLKRYKKQLAQKNQTIATLNAALVDLDFMNPNS